MSKNYPKIIIKDAWLLRGNASQHLHKLWAKKGEKLADDSDMEKIVSAYQKAWKPVEEKILKGMCDLYGVEFKHNIIDVYIAPWFAAFSDPLVIGVKYEPDEFIDTLTHELLHRLFTNNNVITADERPGVLLKEWIKAVPGEMSKNTRIHIPVHAGLKAIYLDVLKEPYRLERDIAFCNNSKEAWTKPYVEAWGYVQKHDYKEINDKIKAIYSTIAE